MRERKKERNALRKRATGRGRGRRNGTKKQNKPPSPAQEMSATVWSPVMSSRSSRGPSWTLTLRKEREEEKREREFSFQVSFFSCESEVKKR